jgi:excisionase family DNA binding protein
MQATRHLTTFQASRALGVSLATIVNWIDAGRIPAHRTPGGHRRIALDDLVRFARAWQLPLPPDLAPAELTRPRVLVVDGDEDHLDTVRTMLEIEERYEVEVARSGFLLGLAVARFRPDVLILELGLPGVDGQEVLERLRTERAGRAVPVIACVSWADESARRRVARDFQGVLEKPVDLDRLLATVSAALGLPRRGDEVPGERRTSA